MQTVVYIRNTVLCRFKDGLRMLNVLQAVERHTDAMRSVFVHQCSPLNASDAKHVKKCTDAWRVGHFKISDRRGHPWGIFLCHRKIHWMSCHMVSKYCRSNGSFWHNTSVWQTDRRNCFPLMAVWAFVVVRMLPLASYTAVSRLSEIFGVFWYCLQLQVNDFLLLTCIHSNITNQLSSE